MNRVIVDKLIHTIHTATYDTHHRKTTIRHLFYKTVVLKCYPALLYKMKSSSLYKIEQV